ncbi:unnamed protein product [Parascedosporium putredinis]|uniref:Uncharacterized protein n=1 Tax=Parascedosporium putredinis TaxID=1442378 RepID=A0A9P1MDL8_9PEZI|nr:unnamed protein product [Parascedosporium putredinis]CAI8002886.1 unnamed protein product [Parascedosporium putredinis]
MFQSLHASSTGGAPGQAALTPSSRHKRPRSPIDPLTSDDIFETAKGPRRFLLALKPSQLIFIESCNEGARGQGGMSPRRNFRSSPLPAGASHPSRLRPDANPTPRVSGATAGSTSHRKPTMSQLIAGIAECADRIAENTEVLAGAEKRAANSLEVISECQNTLADCLETISEQNKGIADMQKVMRESLARITGFQAGIFRALERVSICVDHVLAREEGEEEEEEEGEEAVTKATPNAAATSPSHPLAAQYVVRQHLPQTQSVLREPATGDRLRDRGRRKPSLRAKGDASRPTPTPTPTLTPKGRKRARTSVSDGSEDELDDMTPAARSGTRCAKCAAAKRACVDIPVDAQSVVSAFCEAYVTFDVDKSMLNREPKKRSDRAAAAQPTTATYIAAPAQHRPAPPPLGTPKTEDLLQAIVDMQQRVIDTNERLIRTEERLNTTHEALLETQESLLLVLREIREARRSGTRNIILQCRIPTFEEEE